MTHSLRPGDAPAHGRRDLKSPGSPAAAATPLHRRENVARFTGPSKVRYTSWRPDTFARAAVTVVYAYRSPVDGTEAVPRIRPVGESNRTVTRADSTVDTDAVNRAGPLKA